MFKVVSSHFWGAPSGIFATKEDALKYVLNAIAVMGIEFEKVEPDVHTTRFVAKKICYTVSPSSNIEEGILGYPAIDIVPFVQELNEDGSYILKYIEGKPLLPKEYNAEIPKEHKDFYKKKREELISGKTILEGMLSD